MVGEGIWTIKSIEISFLSIDVKSQQERHLHVVGSLPNNNPVPIPVLFLYLLRGRLSGRRAEYSVRRRNIRNGIGSDGWPAYCLCLCTAFRIRCCRTIETLLQTV